MTKCCPLLRAIVFSLLFSTTLAFSQITPPAGLIGWWTGDSNAVDLVNYNNGTLLNGATYGSGIVSNAFFFDGVNDTVQSPDSPAYAFGTNEFSIELWANFSATNGQRALVASDTGGGNQNKWIFWINNNILQFHINNPSFGAIFIGSAPLGVNLGQWYHLAVTRKSTNYIFYINSNPVSTNIDTHAVPDATASLTFASAEGALFFGGQLDEISIYNRAIDSNEVANIYNAGSAGKLKSAYTTTNDIWAAPVSGDWNVATNWLPIRVPRTGDSVWITNDGTYLITNSAPATLNGLTMGSPIGTQTLHLPASTLTVTNLFARSSAAINLFGANLLSVGAFDFGGTIFQTTGSFRLLTPGTLGTYNLTNGELRGATLITTNFNWFAGNIYAETPGDRTIIPTNGTFNLAGPAARVLSYYTGGFGRGIDNYGTWNWSSNSVVTAYPCLVNNYGILNITGTGPNTGAAGTYAQFANTISTLPNFNNYGTINKTPGTNNFYMGTCNLKNDGAINIQSGQFYLYFSGTTNTGSITAQNGTLIVQNTTMTNSGPISVQNGSFQVNSSTFNNRSAISVTTNLFQVNASTFNNAGPITLSSNTVFSLEAGSVLSFDQAASLVSPDLNSVRLVNATMSFRSTNLVTPSLQITAGTWNQQTNFTFPRISQTGGTFHTFTTSALDTYNLGGGEMRGATMVITNLNWTDGNLNADVAGDKTIIPANGVLNFTGNVASRYLSYYTGRGRDLDNFGTWNWTGTNTVLYGNHGSVVSNYGSINITGTGGSGTYAQFANADSTVPYFYNLGNITKTGGSNTFYIVGTYINNYGLFDMQSGQLDIYTATLTNYPTGSIQLGLNAQMIAEVGSVVTFNANSYLGGISPNAVRVESATLYMFTTNIAMPSMLINNSGSSVQQNTNNVIPTVNQVGGTWRLNVPLTTVGTYNFNGGELRGGNLIVTNLNWLGGAFNSDNAASNLTVIPTGGTLAISTSGAKNLSDYSGGNGRQLINRGTGTWGGGNIVNSQGARIINQGTLTMTNDVSISNGGGTPPPVIDNQGGTLNKTGGTGVASFAVNFTNSGSINISSGGISIGGTYVQNAGSAYLGTNFAIGSFARVEAGSFTGRGNIAGTAYNNGAFNPGGSPGVVTGTSFTNTTSATVNIELGGTLAGTNYDQIALSGAAVLNGTMNVQFVNGFVPVLSNSFIVMTFASRSGTFANITTPPDFTFTPIYSTTNLVLLLTGLTNAPLQILTAPTNITVWQPDAANFFGAASGSTPISYQWLVNGTNIPGATNVNLFINPTAPSDSGPYTFQVTDGNGAQTNVSATLTVIPFNGTITWTNTSGGNWATPANWLPARVPGATNTAVITNAGIYTVTISSPVAVSNVVVGKPGVTEALSLTVSDTLTLGSHATFETNSTLNLNVAIRTLNSVMDIRGLMNWNSGSISGFGRTIVTNTGRIAFNGYNTSKILSTNIMENYGTFSYSGDGGFGPGMLMSFAGGAILTNQPGGLLQTTAGNGYDYAGTQNPRCYLVNYGTIQATSARSDAPCTISVDLINYGLLQNFGFVYLYRGTNFGEFFCNNAICEISIFGDPTAGEYFSFEPGTSLTGPRPNIACGGPVQWRATNSVHAGRLFVGAGTGGATFANAEFRILANYTNTYQVNVGRGFLTLTNPTVVADMASFVDGVFNNAHTFTVVNQGTMYCGSFTHASRNFDNSGLLVARTSLNMASSSFYGTTRGVVIINAAASAIFTGGAIDNQSVLNFGTTTPSAATPFSNSYFENEANAQLSFANGSLQTGPSTVANFGTISGYGSLAITTTNFASVIVDDSLNRTLTLSDYQQLAGLTDIRRGVLGGMIRILGGVITGTNTISGSLFNSSTNLPGKPFGTLAITGNYTNTASGYETMPIGATNFVTGYPTIRVTGTANLAGTLKVTFTNGFFPTVGSVFTVLTYTTRVGTFDNIILPNYQFEVIYTPTNLLLRASNALPIVTFSITGGSTQMVCTPFQLKASATDPDGAVTNIAFYVDSQLISSSGGSAATTTFESDFPSTRVFEARATDDRSGTSASTNFSKTLVTGPLNLLTLGGVRTNGFKICMVGDTGSNYMVLATTNIAAPILSWTQLGLMENTNGIWRYFDAGTMTNNPYRFYRAREQ